MAALTRHDSREAELELEGDVGGGDIQEVLRSRGDVEDGRGADNGRKGGGDEEGADRRRGLAEDIENGVLSGRRSTTQNDTTGGRSRTGSIRWRSAPGVEEAGIGSNELTHRRIPDNITRRTHSNSCSNSFERANG